MKTTIVIPNYNGIKYLHDCLKSLEPEKDSFHTLVIDNGSADGSAEAAAREFPWVQMVYLQENTGFCGAVNTGIECSRTPYVFLLNNDTVVRPGCVAALERRMEEDQKIFSVSAKMVSMQDPGVLDGAGDLYSALGWGHALGKGKPIEKFDRPANIFSACGGAALYRREVLLEIGGFDQNHFAYLEDVDLGYRAAIYGYANVYEPGAVVLHAGSGVTGSRYNPFKISHSSRNNVYLIYKNMPFLQLLLNLPFLLAGFGIKTLFFIKKGYGGTYVKGLGKGIALCASPEGRAHKVPFQWNHLGNYIKIQFWLWWNLFRSFQ